MFCSWLLMNQILLTKAKNRFAKVIVIYYVLCSSNPWPYRTLVNIHNICSKSSSLAENIGANSGVRNSLFFIFGSKSTSWKSSLFTAVLCDTNDLGLKLWVWNGLARFCFFSSSITTVLSELGGPNIIPANGRVQSLICNIFLIDRPNSNETHKCGRLFWTVSYNLLLLY